MKKLFTLLLIIPVFYLGCKEASEPNDKYKLIYPETAKVDVIDEYFGHSVADPYRWLEDDKSPEVGEWVKQQNALTFGYLDQIPFRNRLRERLTEIWDYPRTSAPIKRGNRYFLYKNDGLQNQDVLFYKNDIDGELIEILDPNKLDEDGTISLAGTSVTKDGRYIAYSVSTGGSDWREVFVRDIETGEDLDDHIKWVKFSRIAWYEDGFFYARYPEPKEGRELTAENIDCQVYYHKLGNDQKNDKLIYKNPDDPNLGFSVKVTDNQELLIIYASASTSGNAVYYLNLNKPGSKVNKLIESYENINYVLDYEDGKIILYTNYKAPKYRLVQIDLNKPDVKNWKEIIPENHAVLSSVRIFRNRIIANYLEDARSIVRIFDSKGNYIEDLDLTAIGTFRGFSGDKDDEITFFTVTSFTTPSTIYKYYINENRSELYQESKIDFDTENYITKQVFYKSKDGTKVPMFIVHKNGIGLDGRNPTLLYGYGGFNISLTPHFSIARLIWLEQGGIYAVANIRGGGEYGEKWHSAGTRMNRQNVFDDFIAAAEYLIENNYTSPERLAIQGGSNGGLLVGAVINQRPELFAVGLISVGVLDMLRYHLFTIGRYWATDYGTSDESEEMFKYLFAYSPLHNIQEGVEYPAVLVTTGDHDDRVVPAHSFKYIATLQEIYRGDNPVLIRIETETGHGRGKPTSKIIEEISDVIAFTFYNMQFTPLFED